MIDMIIPVYEAGRWNPASVRGVVASWFQKFLVLWDTQATVVIYILMDFFFFWLL